MWHSWVCGAKRTLIQEVESLCPLCAMQRHVKERIYEPTAFIRGRKSRISKERKDEKTQTQCWYEKWKQSDKVLLGMQRKDDSGMTPRLLIWDTEWVMLPFMKLTRLGKRQVLLDYCLACSGFWLTGWLVGVAGRKF